MINILRELEPLRIDGRKYLVQELDEFSEVVFFEKGHYKIGYTVNREEIYKIYYEGVNVIGAYGVTFNKRALYIYKTVTTCQGYFIRKKNWLDIF